MDQEKAAKYLTEIAEILNLKGENPFKIRAFEKAALIIREVPEFMKFVQEKRLTEIPGIGKGIADILYELLIEKSESTLNELKSSLPPGLLELTQVPGLGPKKAIRLIEELEIHTLRELEYACKENRLLLLKGFGEKIQSKILEGTQFLLSSLGQARWADQQPIAESLIDYLRKAHPKNRFEWTGAYRRKLEVLSQLELITDLKSVPEKEIEDFKSKHPALLPVHTHLSTQEEFEIRWFESTATPEFLKGQKALKKLKKNVVFPKDPVFWESEEILLFSESEQSELLQGPEQITGIFHNHTTASDGSASLKAMVERAYELGYQYIGITEHSESAYYAQGLNKESLKKQKKEIEQVQKMYPKIRIFWGIESDILKDGSLDYDRNTLKEFDFVIASIHSRFAMGEKEMTDRIVKAIENPATTMIGHLTGRLLLGRPGYPLNFERIFKAARDHDVVIEINAHPARLDIDWRHGPELRRYKIKTSINPDAHDLQGLEYTRFGVVTAQKALLPRSQILNTWSLSKIESWLKARRA